MTFAKEGDNRVKAVVLARGLGTRMKAADDAAALSVDQVGRATALEAYSILARTLAVTWPLAWVN